MIEHSREGSLREKDGTGLQISLWKQPDATNIQHYATSQRENYKLDNDEHCDLGIDI